MVTHPYLEGVDGIVLDQSDNIIGAANERNAIVVADQRGRVIELFRNRTTDTRLRNEGPLEFPTSPVFSGRTLCVTNSDGARRDNFPNNAGERVRRSPACERSSRGSPEACLAGQALKLGPANGLP
jgi:hypothetical protein